MNLRPPDYKSGDEANGLLMKLGRSTPPVNHTRLVGEPAELLLSQLLRLRVRLSADFVEAGGILDDAGKIPSPE